MKDRLYFDFVNDLFNSAIAKNRGINNTTSNPLVLTRLMQLTYYVLNPFRTWLGKPVIVESGYRCKDLNIILGGSDSGHPEGYCADIVVKGMTQEQLFLKVVECFRAGIIEIDQLIWEQDSNCVHIGYRHNNNRHQIMVRKKVNDKFVYSNYKF